MSDRNHVSDNEEQPAGVTASANGRPMIALEGVSKRYPGAAGYAVRDLSLEIREGETVVFVGPSGCGKTTVLKMINRLIEPSGGAIRVGGRSVMDEDPVALRRGIGYVIQSVGLLPHRTIAQNIATVPDLSGWEPARTSQRVRELAGMLELSPDLLERYPAELSGGQRQRVGVARALAVDPPVMLMDEPFGAVDPIVRSRLQDQFIELQASLKKTIVMVTHDIDEAVKLADRIAILNTGAALEQYAGPEEILRSPAGDFVKEFIGDERGLKRLALIRVGDIGCEQGPVVAPDATPGEARRKMAASGYDWTSVVEDGRLLGWVDETAIAGVDRVRDVQARPFSAHLMASSTLREALDAIVTSRTQVAVVVEGDERYLGLLTLERISHEIIS